MYNKEDYYKCLNRIKEDIDKYIIQNINYKIHPLDVILHRWLADFLSLSLVSINKLKEHFSITIDNIYLENKEFFDHVNKNLNPENTINGVTLSFDKNIKYETEEDIKKELQKVLEKNSNEIIITPISTKIH